MFVLTTIVLFEIIILVHEFGHFFAAKIFSVEVKEFSIGFGPCILKFKKKNTLYCLRAFFFGGFVSFNDEKKYLKVHILKRIAIVLAGPFVNIFFGMLSIFLVFMVQGQFNSTQVGQVLEFCDGVKVGDEIKKINGKNVLCANDFMFELHKLPLNKPINLTVKRNKKIVEVLNVGKVFKENEKENRVLGISLKQQKINFLSGVEQSFRNSLFFIKVVFSSIVDIFTGSISLKDFSGPVGMVKVVGEAEKQGFLHLMFLFAALSINIGVFNLFPFFVLDGGQFLFLVFEAIFKKQINEKVQIIFNNIGFLILILLFVLITIKDIYMIFVT